MNKKHHIPHQQKFTPPKAAMQQKPIASSLLDVMQDGREFESLLHYKFEGNLSHEIKKALKEVVEVTKRYTICYCSNFVNPKIKSDTSINPIDEVPFSELVRAIPADTKDIDIILVTPGGSGEQAYLTLYQSCFFVPYEQKKFFQAPTILIK
jgi:hypothetical protein